MIKHIEYDELLEWQEENRDFNLIDVRKPYEHKRFNIGGKNIPLNEFLTQIHKGEVDVSLPVVVYCKQGVRSRQAVQELQEKFPKGEYYNLNRGTFEPEKLARAGK